MASLLTHSETLAFNGFLSSLDFGDALEWSGITPDRLPLSPPQGKEALAKATKDLMALEPDLHASDAHHHPHPHPQARPPPDVPSSWPSFRAEPQQEQRAHDYTYGFAIPSSSRQPRGEQRRSPSQDLFALPRPPSPRAHDAAGSASSLLSFPAADASRPSPFAAASAPAALNRSASSSKRSLPESDWPGASTKRRRPSVVSQTSSQADAPPFAASRPRTTRASSVSSTATATPRDSEPGVKPALLSPSQKRANHIQSEQKRRANIRKGYEALCEVVPALRDAIRAEEESARDDEKKKRKKKGKSAEEEKPDGRAGPKSENVVLQKTIDYLNGLLAERMTLSARLDQARSALPNGHQALACSINHLDDKGTPLWEREWTGGKGWGDAEDDGEDD